MLLVFLKIEIQGIDEKCMRMGAEGRRKRGIYSYYCVCVMLCL